MIAIWRNEKTRALSYQIIVIGLLVLTVGYFFENARDNLQRQGVVSGFDFLNNQASFDIIMHLIDYDETSSYFRAFIVGLLNTLLVSFLGIIIATVLGLIVGLARLSSNWLVRQLASLYVEIFRNIPLLLQIFFWYFAVLRTLPSPRQSYHLFDTFFLNIRGIYCPKPIPLDGFSLVVCSAIAGIVLSYLWYKFSKTIQRSTGQQLPILIPSCLVISLLALLSYFATGQPISFDYPQLTGFNFQGGLVIIPELVALLFALSIYTASFIAEIVRAGILSVNKGQREAAESLGLKSSLVTRLIILPQALRVIIPPLTSQYLNLTKNSSLAAAIAYPDLVSVFAGTVLNQTGQAIEVIGITMAVYLSISLVISAFMNWYNSKMALVER